MDFRLWPCPNLRCLYRELQFEIHVPAASGSLLASPRTDGPGQEPTNTAVRFQASREALEKN